MIFIKCKNADDHAARLCQKIDESYRNSDFPTRTQTEEAFGKMFSDMLGDLQNAIYGIGAAVVVSLLFVAGNAMAMAMRERTSEVAVLKAIGFSKSWCCSWCWPRRSWSRASEALWIARLQGTLRHLRHRQVHRRFPSLFLRPLEDRDSGTGDFSLRGVRQRLCSRAPGGQLFRDQRPEEGGLTASLKTTTFAQTWGLHAMKHFRYIFRNARRNPVRSILTIASTGICLFLMMILLSFFAINDEVGGASRGSTTGSSR